MRFGADQLATMLLESNGTNGPLHHRLSAGLRELIELGELPPDALLPSERGLASALAVSRTTVVAAYQTLREDGLLVRRQGSGTRVSVPSTRYQRETVSARALTDDDPNSQLHGGQFLHEPLATVDFSAAALPCLPLVPEVAAGLTEADYTALGADHHGYHPRGLPALRERLARAYTESGVPTTAEEILITSGAQQALELITHGCLQPGDSVITEAPTYRGALQALSLANCRIRSVPCDEHGLDVSQVERLVTDRPARLIYAQSTVHNPTGAVLAETRRHQLARLAEQRRVIVVDDTALADTVFDPLAAQALAAFTTSDRVLTIGSMSKLFWGGLRIGWIRGRAHVISRLAQMKGITDLGTSLVSQQIAVHLLDRVGEATRVRQDQLSAGLATLTGLLEQHLPDWTWQQPRGGASLWVHVPADSVTSFAHVASRFGVAILPGTVFMPDGGGDDHTRLPYALPRPVLSAGVARLARAWDAYTSGHRPLPVAAATT